MTLATGRAKRSAPPRRIDYASLAIQAVFLIAVAAIVAFFILNAVNAIHAQRMTTGFGFLERPRGWSMPPSIFETGNQDTYLKTISVGALNTLCLGVAAIILASLVGFLVGVAQVGSNVLLRGLARGYVQIFRNIPTIVYVVFIFGVMLGLPPPRRAINMFDIAFLSNRGLLLPGIDAPAAYWGAAALLIVLAVMAWLVARRRQTRADKPSSRRFGVLLILAMLASLCALTAAFAMSGDLQLSIPVLAGFNFVGGMLLTIEVTTIVLALSVFGSAYIGEIVRGGLLGVPKGMTEAAGALGLKPWQIFALVRLPIAMRAIIPALSNQYLYMMKATSLGIVIGFADLFTISSLSINYSGQTLEILGVMMAIFIVINFTISQMTNALNRHLQFKTNRN